MNYTAEQLEVKRHLIQDKQGDVKYISQGALTGDEWNPTIGAGTNYDLSAVVTGVSKKYIDGSLVLASDEMVTCAVFDVEPNASGKVSIDSKNYEIVRIIRTPSAGTVLAWKIIVRS